MRFRPCIDIHNGRVKQIVGGSLTDEGNAARDNFVSTRNADYYAALYKKYGLKGGHIILLNPKTSEYYEEDKKQAFLALSEYPYGFQIGGGITAENAKEFLSAGASHVIVTSYVFRNGRIDFDNLNQIVKAVGTDRLVLDLSCRKKAGKYFIVTDRWQKFTDMELTVENMKRLSAYCDEFLIHAVDVEGKVNGIETDLAEMIGKFDDIKVTYAGGISSVKDLELLKKAGNSRIDFTVGSALDIFGGNLKFEEVAEYR